MSSSNSSSLPVVFTVIALLALVAAVVFQDLELSSYTAAPSLFPG